MVLRIFSILFILVATSGFAGSWSSSKPKAWSVWKSHNAGNAAPVNHQAWEILLKRYIKTDSAGLNRFAYSKVGAQDKAALKAYIKSLSKIKITSHSKPVQLAYWINLYNALTIDVILDHYPVKSIRDIDISGVFSNGPWDKKLINIEGHALSLNDIEHRILRPIWKDPRIHYAVNCASIGCPNLQTVSFTAQNVQNLLDQGAREFINHPRGLTIKGSKVTVSKIYQWFAYDFGNSEKNIINHLAQYATPKTATKLKKVGRLSNAKYDWALNE